MIVPASKPAMLALRVSAMLSAILGGTVPVLAMQAPAAGHQAHAGHAAPTGQQLKATLVGTTEVPGPGDPDGTGSATVTIDTAKNQLCYTLTVDKVEGVTMAHVHKAPMGSMGNVVVPLAAPTSGSSEGCAQVRPDLAAAILASPGDFYVNVHSQANPAGAVRGQLGK